MSEHGSWYDQDEFWELNEPILFNAQRQSSAIAEVEKIVTLLQLEERARILDLCCGVGRHSLEFARRGFDVVGVDRTTAYIEKARQAASRQNLNAEFTVADMRKYYKPNYFDLIVNLFGSFAYFEDQADDRKVVEHMYASLRPGGRFLIETMGKEILARDFQEKDWTEVGDTLVLSAREITHNWERINTRWVIIKDSQRHEFNVSLRSYSAVELSSLFYECGFPVVSVYGDIDGAEYGRAAKRLVVVGCKRSDSLTIHNSALGQ